MEIINQDQNPIIGTDIEKIITDHCKYTSLNREVLGAQITIDTMQEGFKTNIFQALHYPTSIDGC